MERLFVTGGSGFLGSRLLARLVERGAEVTALRRTGGGSGGGAVRWVTGDLRDPGSYAAALEGAGTVVHLAAATGSEPARVHEQVNHRGTVDLVARAREAGVPRFLLVSSIAAGFSRRDRYPYARSKAAAEEVVAASGLRRLILRPTLILGPGSPALRGIQRLARLPLIPMFGSGRTPVQPVDVDDLARILSRLALEPDRFDGSTLEIGGPQIVTIEELIQAVRRSRGRPPGPVVHLPAGPIVALLWWLERAGLRLPLTAGQIQTFLQDGTAAAGPAPDPGFRLTALDSSLRRSLAGAVA